MTNIAGLRNIRNPVERKRIAERLMAIRQSLKSQNVPARNLDDTLLLASWNIRDFDSNKFRHGKRLRESFYYLAEIISAFDVVALQEVNDDMSGLQKLMRILGPAWKFIATDTAGNNERMAFVYDRNKVWFRDIAGEIVLDYVPRKPTRQEILDFAKQVESVDAKGLKKLLDERNALDPNRQFNRTPYTVAFQSGWFKFKLCTVHIYYGANSGVELQRRVKEIRDIAKDLAKRADKDRDDHYILLGDFNIMHPEHETMKALVDNGFEVPQQIDRTNVRETMYYDQIPFRLKNKELMPGAANVFRFNRAVFRDADFEVYRDTMKKVSGVLKGTETDDQLKTYYKDDWRTFQMSDHNLLWTELKINFAQDYLKDRVREADAELLPPVP
jgi:endonuclease/exonuclease/phosphatase family metal-dependent hydrolase